MSVSITNPETGAQRDISRAVIKTWRKQGWLLTEEVAAAREASIKAHPSSYLPSVEESEIYEPETEA